MVDDEMEHGVPPTVVQRPINRRRLSEKVVSAARFSQKMNRRQSSNLPHLNLVKMRLHGRDDNMKLLKNKLREFAKAKNSGDDDGHDDVARRLELLLVSGVSG